MDIEMNSDEKQENQLEVNVHGLELNVHRFSGRWRMNNDIGYGYDMHLAEGIPREYTDYFVTSELIRDRRKQTWFEWKNIKLVLLFLFLPGNNHMHSRWYVLRNVSA